MSTSAGSPVIIVRKRGGGHKGHHGGAWKVAYADFVTAMMAFFLVMWIVGQSQAVRSAVAAYFRDPGAFQDAGKGILPGAERGTVGGAESQPDVARAKAALQRAARHLEETLATKFGEVKDRIDIRVTDEGLLIELREAPNDGFFATGSATAKPETVEILGTIGKELGTLPNKIAIEGHTDSRPYASTEGYSNWELSTDRANTARRVLERRGLRPGQIEAVRGYADTRLRAGTKPMDAGNRRISIVVRRLDLPAAPGGTPASTTGAPGAAPAGTHVAQTNAHEG
jgi:chemotaxis protein MotB